MEPASGGRHCVRRSGVVSHSVWQRRDVVAFVVTLVTLAGCVDEASTDPPVPEVSRSLVSSPADRTTTVSPAASSASTVETDRVRPAADATIDDDGDVDAAEFTRSVFEEVQSDDPGCTVAVGRDGEVVFAEAYGAASLDPLEPMTVDTVVDIASTSKQFTATAILLLAQRGAIDLDAPLATYLPDLPAWATQPTVGQLMHHDSGIPDYTGLLIERGFAVTGSSTEADALAALGEVADLDFAPGTRWEYSNSNYFLLSQVVLAVTGQDLGAFLTAEVFEPLGLEMVMDPIAPIEEKAVSYQRVNGEWQVADSRWEQLGDGAIQTTPSQLVAWAAQYWQPTVGASTIEAERFEGAVDAGQGMRYGAGIVELDDDEVGRMLTHSGAWGGFVTLFVVAPEERVAVAATCTSPTSLRRLPSRLETKLLDAWIGTN